MRHVSRLKSFFWYTIVGVLVTLAVIVSVARYAVGSAGEYRAWFEQQAGDYLGQPVSIGSMDARLVGLKPSILLHDVALRDPDGHQPLAQFGQISIALNPFSSLRQLAPIMDLTVSGADLVVIQHADDSFTLQGARFAPATTIPDETTDEVSALEAWFLSQARLAVEQSRISWIDEKRGRRFLFDGVNVELQNQGARHRLNAAVNLPEDLGKALRLSLDIEGNLLDRRDWVGDIYARAEKLKPAHWLHEVAIRGMYIERGNVDLELWSSWRDGTLQQLEGELDLASLKLRDDNGELALRELAGRLRYRRESDGWQFQLAQGHLRTADEPQVATARPFRVQVQQQGDTSDIQLSDLSLAPLHHLIEKLPMLPQPWREQVLALQPTGTVERLHLALQQGRVTGLVATVQELGLQPMDKFPGVSGMQAELAFDGDNARLRLDSENLIVNLPRLFARPLPPQQLQGELLASRRGEGWQVVGDGLSLASDDIAMQLQVALQWQPGETPLLALLGRIERARAQAVPDYLPVKIMPKGTVTWLNGAFAGGQVTGGTLLLHGQLQKGMLHDRGGTFRVDFTTRDLALDYYKGWPRLEGIEAAVRFSGEGMQLSTQAARIYGARLGTTTVSIERFREPVLQVQGSVAASAGDALRFLRESPLVDAADAALARMDGQGATPLQLSLSLPLAERMKASHPLRLKGEVRFSDNRLKLLDGVVMEAVSGTLNFTESDFTATDITARMYGYPARVDVFTEPSSGGGVAMTMVALQGHAAAEALQQAFPLKVLQQLNGESDWQARLSLKPGESGGAELDIYSSMVGMGVELPAPLAKAPADNRPLSVSLGLAGARAGHNVVHYADLLEVYTLQEGSGGPLQRMALQFADEAPAQLPERDVIHISGTLEGLAWAQWRDLLLQERLSHSDRPMLPVVVDMDKLVLLPPEGEGKQASRSSQTLPDVYFHVRRFIFHGMRLGEMSFHLDPEGDGGRINDIKIDAPHLKLRGEGEWGRLGTTGLQLSMSSPDMGDMLDKLGFASVIRGGKVRGKLAVSWLGTPSDYSLAALRGEGSLKIEEGTIRDVKPGAGKLFGLLSLQALPRRLFLDFSDISAEGLQFSSIEGEIELRDGDAYTDDLLLNALPADVLVSGRTGLVARDFDQQIIVVPKVSDTVSVAGALAWGPQVAAALVVLQKLFQRDIDAATMTRYKVTGSWEKPVITRLDVPAGAENDE